jgi:hypothetical protein
MSVFSWARNTNKAFGSVREFDGVKKIETAILLLNYATLLMQSSFFIDVRVTDTNSKFD